MPEREPESNLPEKAGTVSAGDGEADRRARWDRLPAFAGHCNRYLVQVPNEKIGYVNAILESYDWIARIRTTETGSGILEIHVPCDWDDVFQAAMGGLSEDCVCLFRGWERDMPRRVWGMAEKAN